MPAAPAKQRILCLDIFRGFTMAGMILVDNQGDFNSVFWPFRETAWNGLSTADCIFPAFLFINGLAISLAL
jgi:predicted acyltransferase